MSTQGFTGTDPYLAWQVAPSGGIVVLKMASAADAPTWVLTRYIVDGSGNLTSPQVMFSGTNDTVFIDIGDQSGLPVPLDPTKTYAYVFQTGNGSVQSDNLAVGASITLYPDSLTQILIRAIQAGIRSLVLPGSGTFKNKPQVFHAMPIGSQPTVPQISVNCTLLQQQEVPIGQNNNVDYQNNMSFVGGEALRHYSIAILTNTVEEREFYRDAVLGILNASLGSIFDAIGMNASHRFEIASSQKVADVGSPGFYFAEFLFEVKGNFNVGISTNYGIVEHIVGNTAEQGELFSVPFSP